MRITGSWLLATGFFHMLTRPWLLVILLAVLLPSGCSSSRNPSTAQAPLIRVKLLSSLDTVLVTAHQPPVVRAASDAMAHVMQFPSGQPVQVLLAADNMWRIGGVPAGAG